jgi:hypothetical protein
VLLVLAGTNTDAGDFDDGPDMYCEAPMTLLGAVLGQFRMADCRCGGVKPSRGRHL